MVGALPYGVGVSTERAQQRREARRDALAASALKTLAELGYARASVREIAANSELSHGVIHYYFADKTALITYCVRQYKASCVERYDDLTDGATSAEELARDFADKLAETAAEDTAMHRLWYDLRVQSMFEPVLLDDIHMIDQTLEVMIWRVIERYSELAGAPVGVGPATAYALLDGIFERALGRLFAGRTDALDELRSQVMAVLPRLLGTSS